MRSCVRRGTNLLGEPGALLFRRSTAQAVGKFDATNPYVIDLDYWFRLLAHGDAYFCDEPLASFRVSAQSWSWRIGASQASQFQSFVHRVAFTLNSPVSALDLFWARIAATKNMWLRHVFYKVYLR